MRDKHGNIEGFGKVKYGFFKGQWYWERQFGPIVVMWQHDMEHIGRSRGGIRIWRLRVWKDHFWRVE